MTDGTELEIIAKFLSPERLIFGDSCVKTVERYSNSSDALKPKSSDTRANPRRLKSAKTCGNWLEEKFGAGNEQPSQTFWLHIRNGFVSWPTK
jgi:hypothetical protein